ncbi:hypothetical protein ACI65C_002887 [Semiaphis heraclei]
MILQIPIDNSLIAAVNARGHRFNSLGRWHETLQPPNPREDSLLALRVSSLCVLLLIAGSCWADQQQQLGIPSSLDAESINDLAKKPVKLDPKLPQTPTVALPTSTVSFTTRTEALPSPTVALPTSVSPKTAAVSTSAASTLPALLPTLLPPTPNSSGATKSVSIDNAPTNALRTTPAASTAPSTDTGTVVDFFEAPLLTAFTVQQDSAGVPRRVIPIFTEPGQLERQKILALETRAESGDGGDRNTVEPDRNELELFRENPEYQSLFKRLKNLSIDELASNHQFMSHASKVGAALGSTIDHLDKPEELEKLLTNLGIKHKKYGLTAKHFQVIGDVLVAMISEAIGDNEPELLDLWKSSLTSVLNIIIAACEFINDVIKLRLTKNIANGTLVNAIGSSMFQMHGLK